MIITPAQLAAAQAAVPRRPDGSAQGSVPIENQISVIKSQLAKEINIAQERAARRGWNPVSHEITLQRLRAVLAVLEALRDQGFSSDRASA